MTTIHLTDEQKAQIANDMDSTIEMLSDEEVLAIAAKLNKEINIPFIKEGTEATILFKTVKKIDRVIYQNLPNELYALIKSGSDGISDQDAEDLEKVLASRINKKINIPYIPEWTEEKIFRVVIRVIVNAMRKNYSILNQPQ